jgi:microcystin-dependent protein
MANNISWDEANPANTDDVLEGALRIRESKEAARERLNRDHMVGANADPSAESGMTEGNDSGFHRRVTLQERATYNPSSRLTTVNSGATTKFSEVYLEGGTGAQELKFTTSDSTERTVVTTEQTQTLTNKTLSAPTLNNASLDADSGSVDNVAIGVAVPQIARVTKLGVNKAMPSADGDVDVGNDLTVDGDTVLGTTSADSLTVNATVSGNQNKSGIVGEIKMYGGATAPTGWLLCNGQAVSRTTYADLWGVLSTSYGVGDESTTFNLPNFGGRVPLGAGTSAVDDTAGSTPTYSRGNTGGKIDHKLTDSESGEVGHNHDAYFHGGSHRHRTVQHQNSSTSEWNWKAQSISSQYSGQGKASGAPMDDWDYPLFDEAGDPVALDPHTGDTTVSGTIRKTSSASSTADKVSDVAAADAADAHENMMPYLAVNYIIKT